MKVGAFKRVTVAVDGSPASEAGIRCALSLAGDDTTLLFCSVVDPASAVRDIPIAPPPSRAELHAAARAFGEHGVREARARGVSAQDVVVEGHPAPGILRCARENGSDAIIIGSHGRTGIARVVAGSVAEAVIRGSDVPVAVAHVDDSVRSGPIAVAIDASVAADAALTTAIALALATPCELRLFHVFERADLKRIDTLGQDSAERIEHALLEATAMLEAAAGRVRSSGVAVASSMLEGHPAQELLEAFDRHHCASAVVGTHGHSELDRLLFGSVAATLVERACLPVFVVRRTEWTRHMTSHVKVERRVVCPFSIAPEYAARFLEQFETSPLATLGLGVPGGLKHRVRLRFAIHSDTSDRVRQHEALRISWWSDWEWLPNLSGTLRFRIAPNRETLLLFEGTYVPPFGIAGARLDRLFGRHVATAMARDLLTRLGAALEAGDRAFRATHPGS